MIETSYLSVSALSIDDLAGSTAGSRSNRPSKKASSSGSDEILVGFAILSDTPRAGLSEDWLEWFSETHAPADAEVTMTNTLWVDFAVAVSARVARGDAATTGGGDDDTEQDEREAAGVIEDIVRTVFNTLPEIDYLVMSLPSSGMGDGDGHDRGSKGGGGGGKGVQPPKCLFGAFETLTRHADASPNNLDEAYGKPSLMLCDRMAFLPTLAVR